MALPPAAHPVSYPGPNAARQERAHAHMALFSAGSDGVTLLVPDLGSDTIWCLPYDSASVETPLGAPDDASDGSDDDKGRWDDDGENDRPWH